LSPLVPWVLPDPGAAPVQFVHEDDVAEVFRLAITAEAVEPAYNLAGGGTMTVPEIATELGALRLSVPQALVRRGVDLASRVRLLPTGGEWLDMLTHPIIVDTTRARRRLGWVPRYDTRTALRDMLDRFRASTPGRRKG
jgi:nucleoside-diphosphate-sugar epimerase